MLAAAQFLLEELGDLLYEEVEKSPSGYGVTLVGHSLGAGTSVLLTILLKSKKFFCLVS